MRISRRTLLLRAGASTGLFAAIAACGDGGVRSSASDKNGTISRPAAPPRVGNLPAPEVNHTKFAMVGDSITKASSKHLTEVLGNQGFTDIKIEAEVSRRITVGDGKREPLSGVKTLFSMISDGVDPDVWGIAMGTNDVGKYKSADEYADLIDQMMSMPDAKVPIVWVDVYNPNQLAGTKLFNEVLRERATARGNTSVLSWFDLASDPKEKILRTDHIHPNEQGTLVFADLVSAALA
ncbi:MAG: GDSL-type esterase/lipase family protein [Ilumatobacteraceae bacterium]